MGLLFIPEQNTRLLPGNTTKIPLIYHNVYCKKHIKVAIRLVHQKVFHADKVPHLIANTLYGNVGLDCCYTLVARQKLLFVTRDFPLNLQD